MDEIRGTHSVEAFITNKKMQETDFPEESLETFTVEVGSVEYYLNHLQDLKEQMRDEYGYHFDVKTLAHALFHLSKLNGFLNKDVLTEDTDGPGLGIEIQYRTDKPYPLRVRICEHGWYIIAPCLDGEDAARILMADGE